MAGSQPHDVRLKEQLAATKSERRTVLGEPTTHDPVSPNGSLGSSPFTVFDPGSKEKGGAEAGGGGGQDAWRSKARIQASYGPEKA